MQETQTYQERSRQFLAKAREEFQAGDLVQASEKGWGAAALMVKEAAQRRGMEHETHGHLFVVVRALRNETRDGSLRRLFETASNLHRNFYENWFDSEEVMEDLDRVEQFLNKVEPLL